MTEPQRIEVAILLATHNGARYVQEQIRSLVRNDSQFTLHWLDDHSTDDTQNIVRSVAAELGISLQEHHQPQHLGVPASFFQLLEVVEADVYLFCDQDDIWQPGKIDAALTNILPGLGSPLLCFTDPLLFRDDTPGEFVRVLDALSVSAEVATEDSRIFMPVVGYGHTQGFTRELREIYLKHKDIARQHAFLHDVWMYNIAVASGSARLISDAPTTLFRWHASNSSGGFGGWGNGAKPRPTTTLKQHQHLRRTVARNAQGFILASSTLPQSAKLNKLLEIARLLAKLDKRQSPLALVRLFRRHTFWANTRMATETAAVCLCSDAT